MKILVVEDDDITREYLISGLKGAGHLVESATSGSDGLGLMFGSQFDAIILDRMLPAMDGMAVLKALRANDIMTPVLFLTAIGGVNDRVEGLEAGADDYIVKPFSFAEVAARLAAILRRPAVVSEVVKLQVADLELDLVHRTVTRNGKKLDLLQKEFALLEYFMRSEGRVLSKTMLLQHVWDFQFDPKTSVVETHISRLRSKIDRPFGTPLLHTIKNVGYTLRAPD